MSTTHKPTVTIWQALLAWLAIEVMFFALSALLGRNGAAPAALTWAGLSIPTTLYLIWFLRTQGQQQLAQALGLALAAFTGGVLGTHLRQLICLCFQLLCA